MCDHCPLETEPWKVALEVGANRLSYEADVGLMT